MASQDENDAGQDGWTWTAAPAIPLEDGGLLVKLLAYDGEFPVSYVYEHSGVHGEPVLLYDVDTWLSDLWLAPDGTLLAAGEAGQLHVRTGTRWRVLQSPTEGMLTGVWADENSVCYIASEEGLMRYQRGQFALLASGPDLFVEAVRGTVDGHRLYAIGRAGLFLYTHGGNWVRDHLPTNVNLNGVCVAADGTVHVVGDAGVVLSGGPGQWTILDSDLEDCLDVVDFQGAVYVGTSQGVFKMLDEALVPVLPGVAALRLRVCSGYLCVSGGLSFHRFDGVAWDSRHYIVGS
ncbi:WD40/YVTN/BNR-like repeat-containing protein [Sphaerotilus uruguayifluvii]|uniref:Uncharacterized protein n=1 Tax=Sphaerotilus uruguayifluvii TaxID=2735897 RepID=A0ABX2G2X0_9BURK|nr:hypothetical protein [Leptothrix sp. C29]NRT56643.1 hypothetical protein [Leptothrix sp. C29]